MQYQQFNSTDWNTLLFFLLSRQVGTSTQRHFGSHTDGFAQGRVRVDEFCRCLQRRSPFLMARQDFANHIAAVPDQRYRRR